VTPIRVYLEISPRKVFACALDWPGWCRAGKDEAAALTALADSAPRYAAVAQLVGARFPDAPELDVVQRIEGGAGTAYGVPSANADADHAPVDAAEAKPLADLVAAAWATFDGVRAVSPEELRKGPRGGGRDRDKMTVHVMEADTAYARELGRKHDVPAIDDPRGIAALRESVLEVLREPSAGSAFAGRRWTHRYAARRIAWHALDHAWEMQDRAQPG
jgi:hypothetical protein